MAQSSTNRKRNQLFIHLFGWASILHFFINMVVEFNVAFYSPLFGCISYLVLLGLHYARVNEQIIQILVLVFMNSYIFILNFESLSPVTIIFFAIPIIASALYYNTVQIISLGIITAIESLLLAFVFNELNGRADMHYINFSLFIFILSVLVLTISHSIYFSRVWLQIEQKNHMMEKALISKEGYLQLFFETAKDAIAVFDADNKIISINPAFEELYGWSAEECIGKTIPMVPEERLEEAQIRTVEVQQGKSYSLLETQDIKKDGTLVHVQITLSPIIDAGGNVIATSVISRDISYQKETEKLILQSEKLKVAGEIAAGVAHEIRNPMTVISGFVQMMQSDKEFPYKEYTQLIQSEIERINLIISEFLVLAKPQASIYKKTSINKILTDIVLLFGPEFNMHGISIKGNWKLHDAFILGEEHRIKQVFINMFKNAIDAIDRNGEISLNVRVDAEHSVAIDMYDNGAGISDEELSRVFEPFYTTKATGTGLGLLISQKIIQDHGGSMTIKSIQDCGTTVTVVLPQI